MATATRTIRAPRGTSLTCSGWSQEAARRMLMNNLDPDVAGRPDGLHPDPGASPCGEADAPATADRDGLRMPIGEERGW